MFKSDTVLSDVHLYTPNQRHLMVRLNSMGQPGKAQVHAQNPMHPVTFSAFSCLFLGRGRLGRLDCLPMRLTLLKVLFLP